MRDAGDDDVLAQLAHQLEPLLVERRDRVGTLLVHGAQDLLGERLELVVLRDGLGLAADAEDRADGAVDDRADEALGRRAVGSLAGRRHALLAQERAGGVEVATRLLQGTLAVHHPRARRVAQLLDQRCADLGHADASPSSSAATATGSSASAAAAASGSAAASASVGSLGRRRCLGVGGSLGGRRPRERRLGAAASPRPRRGAAGAANSFAETLLWPAAMPSAIARTIERARADRVVVARDHEVGLVGIAVRVDERDHGQVQALRLPDGERLLLQVDDEDRVRLAAHVGYAAEVRLELLELGLHRDPLLRRQQLELAVVFRRRRSWRYAIRSEIVRQFVSRPPSQRFDTNGMPTRSASVRTAS